VQTSRRMDPRVRRRKAIRWQILMMTYQVNLTVLNDTAPISQSIEGIKNAGPEKIEMA